MFLYPYEQCLNIRGLKAFGFPDFKVHACSLQIHYEIFYEICENI